MGDHESAAEMTAPRICGVTNWIDSAIKPIEKMQDNTLSFVSFWERTNDAAAKAIDFLGCLSNPSEDKNHVSEVNDCLL